MIKHLLPADPSIQYACLWHPDLHLEDILVDPKNPTKIVGITNWQAAEIAPLFDQVRRPYFLDYEGLPTASLERPRPLEDSGEQLDPAARALHLQMEVSVEYQKFLREHNPGLYHVMRFLETSGFELLLLARNLLVDGEALYLAQVVNLEETWAELPGVKESNDAPFPFDFSEDEKAQITADAQSAKFGMDLVQGLKERTFQSYSRPVIMGSDQNEDSGDALRDMSDRLIRGNAFVETSKPSQDSWHGHFETI